jgi:hypothetical protein
MALKKSAAARLKIMRSFNAEVSNPIKKGDDLENRLKLGNMVRQ